MIHRHEGEFSSVDVDERDFADDWTAQPWVGDTNDASLLHLRARLEIVARRVESAVSRRRETDPDPEDTFKGLYITDDVVDQLLNSQKSQLWNSVGDQLVDAVETQADAWEASGAELRLRNLARSFYLDDVDVELLLIALAPDIDQRFERLYGYLHDDVSRRRASVGLALELSGAGASSRLGRSKFSGPGALVESGLLVVEENDRPALSRTLRVPDRVCLFLLGDDAPEPAVAELLQRVSAAATTSAALTHAISVGIRPIYLREKFGAGASAIAARALAQAGMGWIVLDLTRLASANEPAALARIVVREARLRQVALVAAGAEALLERSPGVIGDLADGPAFTIITGTRPWDPVWSKRVPLVLDAPNPSAEDRATDWEAALNGHGKDPSLARATLAFRMTSSQIARAAESARIRADIHQRPMIPEDIQAGARAQNAAGLDRLSHRIEPRARWSELVLPQPVHQQLRELTARARHHDRVLDEWGVGGSATRGRGITALFAGDSGTGKTMAAEVIAGDLGLDLYVIDLSTVIDKYIGETEKNLDRIFTEADRINGVLLFDEADAIFGKRSEVRDARDRYANVEVAYLLQRMERFDGLAVLTTNLRANLDDAFTRRIDVIVDFPMPEDPDRLALWRMHLPPSLPRDETLDLEFMAARFRLSGGNIRNICVGAAYLAADSGDQVGMSQLIRATDREYRKLGRLTVQDEFGPYLDLLDRSGTGHG